MKKIITALFACLPLAGTAQNTWEVPQDHTPQAQPREKKTALFDTRKKAEDPKYLAGAVPMTDGKIVFTLDRDVPGKSADEIYRLVYEILSALTREDNQFEQSRIAVVNKAEHTIAARLKEWLVFHDAFLSLDRTIFNYTLIARAGDNHLTLTMERMSYQYETDRQDGGAALETKAEDWISDREALTRNKQKLSRHSAKFRRKTIDRKDDIFRRVCGKLGIRY